MVIGKDSIWKMLALFAMVLLAVLDVIFCKTDWVCVTNALLIAFGILGGAVKLYHKWSVKY